MLSYQLFDIFINDDVLRLVNTSVVGSANHLRLVNTGVGLC